MSPNSLPVILVSAQNSQTAERFISELIGKEAVHNSEDKNISHVWHLENKYYQADVQLYPIGDGDSVPADLVDLIEAHVIYVTDEELDNIVSQAEKRLGQVGVVDVCLLVLEAKGTPTAVHTWACSHHYECVPLQETEDSQSDSEDEADDFFVETYGIERVRATLHAHTWSGLERLHTTPEVTSNYVDGLEPTSEEEDVERAEAFAAALGALTAVREGVCAETDDDTRRRRAEQALAAFCMALGTPLDSL